MKKNFSSSLCSHCIIQADKWIVFFSLFLLFWLFSLHFACVLTWFFSSFVLILRAMCFCLVCLCSLLVRAHFHVFFFHPFIFNNLKTNFIRLKQHFISILKTLSLAYRSKEKWTKKNEENYKNVWQMNEILPFCG